MSNAFAGQFSKLQRNGVTIAEMTKIQGTGSKADVIDVTNMDSPTAYREKLVTLLDAGDISFDGNLIAGDATQQQVQADFDGRTLSPWSIILPDDPATGATRGHWDFEAYVISVDFDLQHDKQATIS
ncbi:MAG TPA: phage tail tube protein, partial [Chloroflexota bacterium]|nr:phage tail tube protein [Chloroflexota bacterium]